MSLTNQDFDMFAGDTKYLSVTVKNADGTVVDLTGATIKWACVKGTTTVISKDTAHGITITDAINGKYSIKLDSVDTSSIIGSFYHESVIIDILNNKSTVFKGTMKVSPSYI